MGVTIPTSDEGTLLPHRAVATGTAGKVRSTIHRWFNPTSVTAERLRDTLMGVLVTVGFAEACVYRLMQHQVAAGQLPAYTADVLIVCYFVLEACVAPLVSWWGYRARRRVLISWATLLVACFTAWFLLQSPGQKEEALCSTSTLPNPMNVGRLILLLASGPVLVAARAAVWGHGLAYIEDHAPDRMPLHYSIFVLTRVLPLLLGAGMVSLVDHHLPAQVALLLVGTAVSVLQLMLAVPKQDPKVAGEVKSPPPMNDRGFCTSVSRVVRKPLVMCQLLAAALLAAALWDYGYYRSDVVKVKYNMSASRNSLSNFAEIMRYEILVFVVVLGAILLSPPLWARFCRTRAVLAALGAGGMAVVMMSMMMIMSTCEPGTMQLDTNCSLQCGCSDRPVEFSPVCVLDDLRSYPSPCHAGCSQLDELDGLSVYVNCTCGSRAVAGACGDRCQPASDLHQTLFMMVVGLVVTGMSVNCVVALRAADARDRGVVVGLGGTVVALVVAATHASLAVVTSGMCSLSAGGVCVLPSPGLPRLVGVSSVVLMVLSCLISAGTWLRLRRTKEMDTDQ